MFWFIFAHSCLETSFSHGLSSRGSYSTISVVGNSVSKTYLEVQSHILERLGRVGGKTGIAVKTELGKLVQRKPEEREMEIERYRES